MGWQAFMEDARRAAREAEELTRRIENGGRDWSAGGAGPRGRGQSSPTEAAAMAEMTVVPQLVERRSWLERTVAEARAGTRAVRDGLGATEADVLAMFYLDGFLSGEIAGELGLTVDGVFYRKRRALAWMDENLPLPR